MWVRLEQKAGEGLANPIHKYILPMCISRTRPFSKVKLLKPPSLSSSQDKIPFISLLAETADLGGQRHSLQDVCAGAVDTSESCSFLVEMLGHSCHDAGVRWEAVPQQS